MAGYKPVLVDIDPLSMNIDFNHIEKHVNSNTKALFLVHLLGNPCDMDACLDFCRSHNLRS